MTNQKNAKKYVSYLHNSKKCCIFAALLDNTKVPTVKTLLLHMAKATAYHPSTSGMAAYGNACEGVCAI